jgi:methylthioribose-1-phosphate isomerase
LICSVEKMAANQSPLFTPALWEKDHFRIIDETRLPWKVEYLTVRDVAQALAAVKEMKTRAFGQALAFFYAAALVARAERGKPAAALRERLVLLAEQFSAARPTFDFKGLAKFFDRWFEELAASEDAGNRIEGRIHEFVSAIYRAREQRARRAAELLPNPCRLLTHCNISGELVAVARSCQAMGKEFQVIATETRPYLQGSRLTAWEVAAAGVPVTLIPDSAIAQVMANGAVNAVLVGADRSAQNGDIVNKVGTYPLALMAHEHRIPFYALVQEPGSLASGADTVIEERPLSELFSFQGRSFAPQGLKGRYPAFDVTPASLITSLIGFDGAFTPESFRQRYLKGRPAAADSRSEKESYLLLFGIPRQEDHPFLSQVLKAQQAAAILVPEMRPELWGIHRIARRLVEKGLPTTLISDNMMGAFFAQGQIKRLCLFYSALKENGVVGICGSLLAVLLARRHGVPVELIAAEAAAEPPLDRDVSTFLGEPVSPQGVTVYPIEKEVIPWPLFKAA